MFKRCLFVILALALAFPRVTAFAATNGTKAENIAKLADYVEENGKEHGKGFLLAGYTSNKVSVGLKYYPSTGGFHFSYGYQKGKGEDAKVILVEFGTKKFGKTYNVTITRIYSKEKQYVLKCSLSSATYAGKASELTFFDFSQAKDTGVIGITATDAEKDAAKRVKYALRAWNSLMEPSGVTLKTLGLKKFK